MSNSFSVNLKLVQPALSKVERELEQLNERIDEIFKRAVVKDQPIVQSIVHYFDPTPEECMMLSKVFGRMAELQAKRKELSSQVSLLKGMTDKSDWLYEQVGDHSRDVDTLLNDIMSNSAHNERETK